MKESKHTSPEPDPKAGHEDIERRLDSLEKSLAETRKDYFDGHKWFTTFIFSLVGVLLWVMSTSSKSDVHEAIVDMKADLHESTMSMQRQVDVATMDMQKKIAALAGEAVKKPSLQVSTKRGPLNGLELQASGQDVPFYPLFIKNVGDRRSDSLSVRLYSSAPIGFNGFGAYSWIQVASSENDYPFAYWYARDARATSVQINPQETWTLEDDPSSIAASIYPSGTNKLVNCELRIYYGVETPSLAKFRIKFAGP